MSWKLLLPVFDSLCAAVHPLTQRKANSKHAGVYQENEKALSRVLQITRSKLVRSRCKAAQVRLMATRTALMERGKRLLAGPAKGSACSHSTPMGLCQTKTEVYPPQALPTMAHIAMTMYAAASANGVDDVSPDAILMMSYALDVSQ